MVDKCASYGFGGRAWSWPGYTIDRTPYGVMQHELGHHIDNVKTGAAWDTTTDPKILFSKYIYDQSKEQPLTGYLGTDKNTCTFYSEWFAENFRLFVTNPNLCANVRPKFYLAMWDEGFKNCITSAWEKELLNHEAPPRIIEQARKKLV